MDRIVSWLAPIIAASERRLLIAARWLIAARAPMIAGAEALLRRSSVLCRREPSLRAFCSDLHTFPRVTRITQLANGESSLWRRPPSIDSVWSSTSAFGIAREWPRADAGPQPVT